MYLRNGLRKGTKEKVVYVLCNNYSFAHRSVFDPILILRSAKLHGIFAIGRGLYLHPKSVEKNKNMGIEAHEKAEQAVEHANKNYLGFLFNFIHKSIIFVPRRILKNKLALFKDRRILYSQRKILLLRIKEVQCN